MTRQLWIPDKLRAYGLTVVEVTGWQDRGRPGPFDPLGVIVHHTAGPKGKPAPSLQVCIDGRSDLAGPLCNVLLARNCTCYVISAGRCNHAGEGEYRDITDGNGKFLAIEAENDGVGEPWAPDMLDAFHRATAALIDGLGGGHVIAHKEWAPGRKIDPNGIDMPPFRAATDAHLRKGTTTVPTTPTPPSATEAALIEQWQGALLANGAPIGNKDGRFGRLTLEHSRKVLDHRNQLLAQVAKLEADLKVSSEANGSYLADVTGLRAALADAHRDVDTYAKEAERLQALAYVATKAPALLAIVQGLRAQLNEAETKLQGLA